MGIPQTGDLDILRHLGTKIGVRRLDGLEDAGNFTGGRVVLGHVEHGGTLERGSVLGVLLLEFFGVSARREGNGVVVTGGTTTALRVEEGGTTVGRHNEVTTELGGVTLTGEFLQGEEERNTLTTRQLDGDRGVVETILLLDGDGAVGANLEGASHAVEGVGKTGHEAGLGELGLTSLELGFFLDGEGGRFHAELLEGVVASLDFLAGNAAFDDRASVGETGTLHLEVGQALEFVVGDGTRGLRLLNERKGSVIGRDYFDGSPPVQSARVRAPISQMMMRPLWTQFHRTVSPYAVVDDMSSIEHGKTNQFSDNKQIPCGDSLSEWVVFSPFTTRQKNEIQRTPNGKETDRSFERAASEQRVVVGRGGAKSKSYLREDGTGDAEGDGRLGDLLGELLHVSASGRLDGGSVVAGREERG